MHCRLIPILAVWAAAGAEWLLSLVNKKEKKLHLGGLDWAHSPGNHPSPPYPVCDLTNSSREQTAHPGDRLDRGEYSGWSENRNGRTATLGPPLSTSDVPAPNAQRNYEVNVPNFSRPTILAPHLVTSASRAIIMSLQAVLFMRFRWWMPICKHAARNFTGCCIWNIHSLKNSGQMMVNRKLPFIFDEIYGPAVSLWQRERPGPVLKIYAVNSAGGR